MIVDAICYPSSTLNNNLAIRENIDFTEHKTYLYTLFGALSSTLSNLIYLYFLCKYIYKEQGLLNFILKIYAIFTMHDIKVHRWDANEILVIITECEIKPSMSKDLSKIALLAILYKLIYIVKLQGNFEFK